MVQAVGRDIQTAAGVLDMEALGLGTVQVAAAAAAVAVAVAVVDVGLVADGEIRRTITV